MSEGSSTSEGNRALLGGALVSLLAFVAVTATVTTQHFDGIDRAARSFVHQSHSPGFWSVMHGASLLGGRPGQLALVALGVAMLWSGRRRWAVALPPVMLGAGILQLAAKWAVDRPRPNLHAWGFPSAHVLTLVVLCGYLVYTMTGDGRQARRLLAMGVGVAIVGMVAYSRLYLDAHWLSDVLGGLTAGLAYLLGAIWLVSAAPGLGRVLSATLLPSGADALLVPAPAAAPAEPLIAVAPTAAAIPAPLSDSS
jgi:membrane-associated phospholipid phosphatase